MPYRSVPDRVPYGPSPDRVSSHPCAFRRPRCPWHVHGRASRTPVVCHAPAQHGLSPTPPSAIYEHLFFCIAVALYRGPFGGAAKANRWAARIPTHRAEQTRQPERSSITEHHRASPDISGHIRTYPSSQIDGGKKGSSCAVWSGAGSRAAWLVACDRARRVR